jgi:hypothetical protein
VITQLLPITGMIDYLKEMEGAADRVAAGDLTVEQAREAFEQELVGRFQLA